MTENSVIDDPTPLNPEYIPSEFIDRQQEQQQIQKQIEHNGVRNLFIHGARGTGKTHLTLHTTQQTPENTTNTCYINCKNDNTQYQALQQIYHTVTQETINDGHHTADLKREIENRTTTGHTQVILDEIDFLLLNNGNDLLYYLSRTDNLSTILISANHQDIKSQIEERTYSSLQPQRLIFEPLTSEEIYKILRQRAQDSLKPRSLQREALTYIASTTQNLTYALQWLQTAAEQTKSTITENHVKNTQNTAQEHYTNNQLQPLTPHHETLYNAIKKLSQEQQKPLTTGKIYQQYQELCHDTNTEPLTNRRISDYIKHLEILQLIQAQYHYGGQKGKTREIKLNNK